MCVYIYYIFIYMYIYLLIHLSLICLIMIEKEIQLNFLPEISIYLSYFLIFIITISQ